MRSTLIILAIILFAISCTKENPDELFAGDSGTFNDTRDGNEYSWVRIGEQIWMAENLAYLPEVYSSSIGSEDVGGVDDSFFYVYGYSGSDVLTAKATQNYKDYGVLYNYHASMEVCPNGWHLPSDDEWMVLEGEIGMDRGLTDGNQFRGTDEGGKLKEVGFTHWEPENVGATDLFGFTAKPGGIRSVDSFVNIGLGAFFQSATLRSINLEENVFRSLLNGTATIYRGYYPLSQGLSVRCIRD